MFIRFSLFISITFLFSCNLKEKPKVIVYPQYCGGCVLKNFDMLSHKVAKESFSLYFDTTDVFVLNACKKVNLNYKHLDNDEIYRRFGDNANVVVISKKGKLKELNTNQVINTETDF